MVESALNRHASSQMHCLVDTGTQGNAGHTETDASLPLESNMAYHVWKMENRTFWMNGISMFTKYVNLNVCLINKSYFFAE